MFPAQIVITLEELCLPIKRCPTLGETACLAVQRHDLLPDRPIESFEQRSRDLFERNQLFHSEDDSPGDRHQPTPGSLFDNLTITQSRIRHHQRLLGPPTPLAPDEVDEETEDDHQSTDVWLPAIARP